MVGYRQTTQPFPFTCRNQTMSDTSSSSLSDLPDGFKIVHDRKFHNSNKYMLPNDEREVSRLDLQHYIMRHLVHGNFNAPVEEDLERGINVLDMGCGSGRWVLDMAVDYPNSTFTGIDMAEVFPVDPDDIPPNARFMIANTLKGLPFPDETFDYVFQRFMVLSFTPQDWKFAVNEIVRLTKPGGWVELFELACTTERPPVDITVWQGFMTVCAAKGIDHTEVWRLKSHLMAHNFNNVELDYISCPLGWSGRVGEMHVNNLHLAYLAMGPVVAPVLGIDQDEWSTIVQRRMDGFKERKSWQKAPYVYGKKPV
ncbi:S-adenosyl-L-methionine-dependent methyltransferase [Jimgerdemannia flammicorona]|uniref:S-adenosyl-L-methionine-dependent methyltransferase n=1 Tax=Jimgerdemannia flammicorona TaxID=994334 RepID=A0A433DDK8_9FUNG|nr:S-adenosyl-L-methionine-dependent methyltransferase [Jimgerdemannia flammicorona]